MNKGIQRGWDNSGNSLGRGNAVSGFGHHSLGSDRTTKRPTRDALIYYPVEAKPLVGATNPKTWTADQAVTVTNDVSGVGTVGPGYTQIPKDGSVVAISVTVAFSQNAVGTPAIFIYDFDGTNTDVGDTITETHRVYSGKVSGHGASLNFPLVYTGGLNNCQVKYGVDWASATDTAYMYVTGYWVRA